MEVLVQVRYVHDGSESVEDKIYLEMELSPAMGYVLPTYLQGQHRVVLHVNITPINDPPIFTIPTTRTLRVPQVGHNELCSMNSILDVLILFLPFARVAVKSSRRPF